MEYEEVLMVKITWYYYIEKFTQQKISDMLGISRMRVIKLLDKAQQSGIIQFKIREDNAHRIQLERKLMAHFNLNDAFIVPTHPDSKEINETIAKAAAMYINDRVLTNSFINIGYGDTLGKVLNHLATLSTCQFSCVSLTGGVNHYFQNARQSLFSVQLYLTPAPLMCSTKEMAYAMREEHAIKEISRMVKHSDFTLLSIGEVKETSTIYNLGILSKNDILYLGMNGAVGDILCHFIDVEGHLIHSPIEDRLISTPLEVLKTLPNVIGIAAGAQKVEAIRAALKGGYFNVFITDEATAKQLVPET
ncbi:MAG: sugar-binding domain-containing protein [Niameybacter sp.]